MVIINANSIRKHLRVERVRACHIFAVLRQLILENKKRRRNRQILSPVVGRSTHEVRVRF